MNVDHFFWIDTDDIRRPPQSASLEVPSTLSSLLSTFLVRVKGSAQSGGGIGIGTGTSEKIVDSTKKKTSLHDELKEDFGSLPSMKKLDMDNFVIVNVSPSVIPTYYPSVRVFTYNTTGGPDAASAALRACHRGGDDGKSNWDFPRRSYECESSSTRNGDVSGRDDQDEEDDDELDMRNEDRTVLVNQQQTNPEVERSERKHGRQ
jgi:endopolyphosphatase